MHSSLIAWIMRAIPFGTIIMYGALGETVTEKSGNLNLGVPGIMYLGGFAGFASAWAYENTAANPNGFVSIRAVNAGEDSKTMRHCTAGAAGAAAQPASRTSMARISIRRRK